MFPFGLGRGVAVADDTALYSESAGVKGGAAGKAWSIGGVALSETHALFRQCVDAGAGVSWIAGATEMIGTAGVDVDVENSHGGSQAPSLINAEGFEQA